MWVEKKDQPLTLLYCSVGHVPTLKPFADGDVLKSANCFFVKGRLGSIQNFFRHVVITIAWDSQPLGVFATCVTLFLGIFFVLKPLQHPSCGADGPTGAAVQWRRTQIRSTRVTRVFIVQRWFRASVGMKACNLQGLKCDRNLLCAPCIYTTPASNSPPSLLSRVLRKQLVLRKKNNWFFFSVTALFSAEEMWRQ